MKNNAKFATALIVLFITIIGIPIGLLGFKCGANLPPKKFIDTFCNTNKVVIQGSGKPGKLDCELSENVWSGNCEVPFWNSFIINYDHTKTGVKQSAVGILAGTLILDSLVILIYNKFGKAKEIKKREKSNDE